jgi:hypothetical protein
MRIPCGSRDKTTQSHSVRRARSLAVLFLAGPEARRDVVAGQCSQKTGRAWQPKKTETQSTFPSCAARGIAETKGSRRNRKTEKIAKMMSIHERPRFLRAYVHV